MSDGAAQFWAKEQGLLCLKTDGMLNGEKRLSELA
jgi:hypothetical protein